MIHKPPSPVQHPPLAAVTFSRGFLRDFIVSRLVVEAFESVPLYSVALVRWGF